MTNRERPGAWRAISLGAFVLTLGGVAIAADGPTHERTKAGKTSTQSAQEHAPGPMGPMDRILADEVFTRLVDRTSIGAKVDVTARNGTIGLAGTVPSQKAKERAARIAKRTPGVTRVQNGLLVQGPEPELTGDEAEQPDDARLAESVARAIAARLPTARAGEDWWLTGWRVEGADNDWNLIVEADRGQITLEGEVPRSSIIATAVRTAREVDGVEEVQSELELEPTGWLPPYLPQHGVGAPHGYVQSSPYTPSSYREIEAQDDQQASRLSHHAAGKARPQRRHGATTGEPAVVLGDDGTIAGEVTRVDRGDDTVMVRTSSGSTIVLPLKDVGSMSRGDQVEIEVAIREQAEEAGTASP